jgi:hypothetical protein
MVLGAYSPPLPSSDGVLQDAVRFVVGGEQLAIAEVPRLSNEVRPLPVYSLKLVD